ncbi:MAG TPA: HD-GYP domain-containing protein [Solirubrobacteraceae bacterium]|nr:HD-GYP domain-containing protein [Solirubrobacteraceae bacterium]
MPDFTLTKAAPAAESLNVEEERLTPAEVRTEILVATGLFAAVAALFVLDPDASDTSLPVFLLCAGLIGLSHLARFDLPFAWTAPVQLALVPTLFLLPGWLVPVAMMSGIVLARLPDVVRGRTAATRLVLSPGNAWFTVGPAAVLLAAGSPGPQDVGVAVVVAMIVAQIGTDFLISSIFHLRTRSIPFNEQLLESLWVYGIDVALAPVGLMAAIAADANAWYLLLLSPMFAVLAVFAGERRTRLVQLTELNGAYRGTALVLAEVVDADDAYTGMHTRGVVELSVAVADHLQLDEHRRRNVEFGALLHDVGKVAIPNAILNKPGPLNDAEWEIMRTHTVEGQRMLDRVGGFMRDVGAIVRGSHERWDGGGYPDGLAGDRIPLEARIITACDAYNAMTTTRPYRQAMDHAAAAAELRRCSGTQFDPTVVEALLAVAAPAAPARLHLAA